MALKAVLDSLEGLAPEFAKEYKQGSDGRYYLDIDGIDEHPDIGALKRAKDYEKAERQKIAAKLKEVQASLEALTEERDNILKGALPKADVEKLEESWKQKLAKREQELTEQINNLNGHLQRILVDNVAQQIATEISKAPALLLPHIKQRLKVDFVDGKPVTKVLDEDGSISALSIEDLKKEMVANPIYAPIIIGSKASGGGAEGGQRGSAPGTRKLDYAKATPAEIVADIKARKQAGGF